MADPRPAAALFLEAIPNVMCQLRNHLSASNSGLTVAQFRCLKMVQRSAEVSLGELADANGVSAPAMSKLVDGLVEAGLLERRGSTDDRRRIELTVTPAGKRKLDTVGDRLKSRLAAQLSSLAADELEALERALVRLNQVLAEPEVVA
jgi:DNA-binding MarR family transcriptional regulator